MFTWTTQITRTARARLLVQNQPVYIAGDTTAVYIGRIGMNEWSSPQVQSDCMVGVQHARSVSVFALLYIPFILARVENKRQDRIFLEGVSLCEKQGSGELQ